MPGSPVRSSHRPTQFIRVKVTSDEATAIQRIADRYGLSKSAYFRQCLEEADGALGMVLRVGVRNRDVVADIPVTLLARATKEAKRHGIARAEWIRRRLFGSLRRPPPRRRGLRSGPGLLREDEIERGLDPSRPGRPSELDYIIAGKNTLLEALFLSPDHWRGFVQELFDVLETAGVRPGDTSAVMRLARTVVSMEKINEAVGRKPQDPHTPSETISRLKVVCWSPVHGAVRVEEPNPEERRSARKFFQGGRTDQA